MGEQLGEVPDVPMYRRESKDDEVAGGWPVGLQAATGRQTANGTAVSRSGDTQRPGMEELQAKHRKEQRDLQSRITQKKKSATKKTRKGVNDECERWQRELLERQQTEIAELNGDLNAPIEHFDNLHITDNYQAPVTANGPTDADASIAPPPKPKPPPLKHPIKQITRSNEKQAMQAVFDRLGLKERDIAPDGHCLYSAVAVQLAEVGVDLSLDERTPAAKSTGEKQGSTRNDGYKTVRATTGKFVLANADDFAPFIDEPLEEYARKIMFTAEWGGQLELQAMARAYGVEINVIQGDGRNEKFEPGDDKGGERKKIWLAYYRHSYGLGEHYNALSRVA
ncbi:OTU domain -containing protein 6B [Coccidioides immitis RMSCC 3703]|uniref:OTU domain-containing protein 6B n=1 Tax=Coccidioides immitis RMSCC 3703 TaxID=454286 RepID=A0A0J8R979_COCIT|nr:OTU domain -containing protein 6B [Coccidioides immitis RMSCC 3703]